MALVEIPLPQRSVSSFRLDLSCIVNWFSNPRRDLPREYRTFRFILGIYPYFVCLFDLLGEIHQENKEKSCMSVLKVRKSWKEIVVSSMPPKNQPNYFLITALASKMG